MGGVFCVGRAKDKYNFCAAAPGTNEIDENKDYQRLRDAVKAKDGKGNGQC